MQALQEFKELSEEYSEEEMVTLLPYWTSVYTKLALDCEGRVREQSHGCLLSVVSKVGRQLAPHLPQLAGVWYLAQYDPHLPAATAASQAWAAAFPPAKQAGALNFCKGHILALIIENLTLATPHTLSDPNLTTPEEMEAKYWRTLSMSMTALAALMEKAPPSPSQLESLLQHQKFWKFGRSKEGNVRQGLFEVLTQLCSHQPQLASSHSKSLASTVLTSLNETEAGAATAVWTAALQTTRIGGVWEEVSLHKAVLPPLYKFISGAGAGLATRTFPSLMPFLSRIPTSALTAEDCKLVERWLSSFTSALDLLLDSSKAVDHAELDAVIKAYVECVILVLNMGDIGQETKVRVLEEHLINNLLVRSFSEDKLSESCLYEFTGQFVLSWEGKEQMSSLNRALWSCLTHQLTTDIPTSAKLKPALKMLSSFCPHTNSPESVKLVICNVWSVLMEELKHSADREVNVLDCLQNIGYILHKFEIKNDDKLRGRLFSEAGTEEQFLENFVFPLLNQRDLVPSACSLIWSVAALKQPQLAVEILISASQRVEDNEEIIRIILETSQDQQIRLLWLQHQHIKEFIMELILDIEQSLQSKLPSDTQKKSSLVQALIKAGLSLEREEVERILNTLKRGLANKPSNSYLAFVDRFSSLTLDVEDPLWSSGAGADVAFILFTLDDASNSGALWLKCCQEDSKLLCRIYDHINNSLQQDLTLDALKILTKKSQKLIEKTSFATMSGIFPKWEDLKHLSPSYLYEDAVGSRSFFFESPFVMGEDDEEVSLVRPSFSLFWSRIMLCEYFPGEEITGPDSTCETIPDCDRVDIEEDVLLNLAPVIESLCYLSKLVEINPNKETLIALKAELEVCVQKIVTRLSKPSFYRLREELRSLSVGEGRLWCDCLVWLVRTIFNTSEWPPNIPSLLPGEGNSWSEGEIMTTLSLLRLSSQLGLENRLLLQTSETVVASLLSLGDGWEAGSDSLLWLLTQCLSLCPDSSVSELAEQLGCVLPLVQAVAAERKEMLLYDQDISSPGWAAASQVSVLARFLAVLTSRWSALMSPELWDFTCCSLVSWSSSLQETQCHLMVPSPTAMIASAVFHLAGSVSSLMSTSSADSDLPPKLQQEWEEFFSEGIFSVLLPLFVSSAEQRSPQSRSCSSELASALLHCPASQLMTIQLPARHLAEDVDLTPALPDNVTFLYNHLAPLLTSPCFPTQLAAAELLTTVARNTKELQEEEGEEEMKEVPRRLVGVVRQGEALLGSLLQEFKIGEMAGSIPPGTVSFSVSVGYLLAWRVILALIQTSGDELRPKYTEYLKSEDLLFSLMGNLFRLLPKNASQNRSLFSSALQISEPTAEKVPELAGSVWLSLCRHLPAVARSWWLNLDKTGKERVERVTTAVVTPLLWREETRAIAGAEKSDNMSLRVRDSVKEVVATYTIDEGSMELIISLPSNHPLGDLSVDTGNRVGVDVGLWRKWMLQLTTFLSYQNGTILEGLNLWKKNVDKRFEGVEVSKERNNMCFGPH